MCKPRQCLNSQVPPCASMTSHNPNFVSTTFLYFPLKMVGRYIFQSPATKRPARVTSQWPHLKANLSHDLAAFCSSCSMQYCICCVRKRQRSSNQIIKREAIQEVFYSRTSRPDAHREAHSKGESLADREAGRRTH